MTSAQSKSRIRQSRQQVKLRETLKEFSETLLSMAKEIMGVITNNPVTSTAIAGTLAVSPLAYHAVNSQLSGAFQELSSTQQEVLSHFFDQTTELLNQKTIGISSSQLDEHHKNLLSTSALTALRSLDGTGKGRLLRFLSENELIKANQPKVLLSGADLRKIDLEDAWLPDANLQGAYILNGKLIHTNLTRVNLRGAVLTGTNFTDANLMGTNFTGANLTGAYLDINKAVQDGANFCRATMPDRSLSTLPCP